MSWYQKTLIALGTVLVAYAFMGAIFDGFDNSLRWVSPVIRNAVTVGVVMALLVMNLVVRKCRIKWWFGGTAPLPITAIGKKLHWCSLAILLFVWLPTIYFYFSPPVDLEYVAFMTDLKRELVANIHIIEEKLEISDKRYEMMRLEEEHLEKVAKMKIPGIPVPLPYDHLDERLTRDLPKLVLSTGDLLFSKYKDRGDLDYYKKLYAHFGVLQEYEALTLKAFRHTRERYQDMRAWTLTIPAFDKQFRCLIEKEIEILKLADQLKSNLGYSELTVKASAPYFLSLPKETQICEKITQADTIPGEIHFWR